MGLFDFLLGRKTATNCEIVADRIWMTTDAKFAGLAREAQQRSDDQTVAIMLVAHFPDVLARLDAIAAATTEVPVKAVMAHNLTPDLAAGLNLDESSTIDILVGERHPLLSVDERLAEFAGAFPCRCRLTHHLSLDDPVMKVFAGKWVQDMLGRLGMTEDEAIESDMVSRRYTTAQKKLESRAIGNADADSAAEWLEKNCPDISSA